MKITKMDLIHSRNSLITVNCNKNKDSVTQCDIIATQLLCYIFSQFF